MDEEISRQEEARKILEAIRQRDVAAAEEEEEPQKPISHLPAEEADKLQELVAQKLGLKNDGQANEEQLPDPDSIDPISTDQIKVMRKFATAKVEEKKSLQATMLQTIVKTYFEIADSFKLKPDNARRCFVQGHECVHCGRKIPFAILEQYEKQTKEKGKEKPGSSSAANSPPDSTENK